MAAVNSSGVWAVGYYRNGSVYQTLTENWNGTAWTVVASPSPSTSVKYLNGVAAVSSSDVWAVGYYFNGRMDQTLIADWNGTG